MNTRLAAGFIGLSWIITSLAAGESIPPSPPGTPSAVKATPSLTYQPPHRGAPAAGRRIGGGTRSSGSKGPVVAVLAPDHVGLTLKEQPTLYWYVSDSVATPVELEITLIEEHGITPVIKSRLGSAIDPGIHSLRLSDLGVHLSPGARYEWSVALVFDPKRRSQDIVATGGIARVDRASLVSIPRDDLAKPELPKAYAEAGLWYDAIESLSDLIEQSPGDPTYRGQRAALLENAGLKEPSQVDLKR